jgi:hypothetical protein
VCADDEHAQLLAMFPNIVFEEKKSSGECFPYNALSSFFVL